MLDTLSDLATTPQFLTGLRAGIIATVVAVPIGVGWQRRNGRPAPIAGVLLATAALLAIPFERPVPLIIWAGIGLLGAAGLLGSLAPFPRRQIFATALASLPGALLLGFVVEHPGPAWAPWLLTLGVVLAGPLVVDFDSHYQRRAWGAPLLMISILGLLFTVPDTEVALILGGVALPVALLGGPVHLAHLGRAGSLMAVGLFLWVTVLGGQGREGSMVGAATSLGLLVAEPVIRALGGASRLDRLVRPWSGALQVGALHLAVVLVTSRIAGLQFEPIPAAVIAILALGIAGAALRAPPQ